jgi:hypothetical protein
MALQGIQNVKQFGNVIRDISRPYLFLISIPYLGADTKVTAFARTASLPKYTIGVVEIPFQTQKWRIAHTAEFDGKWTVEFLCDEGHSIRNKIIGWMQRAYDPSITRNGAPIEYKADNIKVVQLDRTSAAVVQYQFVGMFPTEVAEIKVAHAGGEEPEQFETIFTYDYWTMAGSVASANADSFFLGISVDTGIGSVAATVGGSIGSIAGTFGLQIQNVF